MARKPVGRPPIFSQAVAETICERIALGESLKSICRDAAMPSMSTVFNWLANPERKTFLDSYERARETQADAIFDEILDIADDGRNDWMKRQRGEEMVDVENAEALNRSRLRIDARKWMAGKLRPKKYGDKVAHEISGNLNITHEQALKELE